MKSPLRVAWTEGLLMAPQHLQQHDRYLEGLVNARIEALGPLWWGVLRVEIDRRALAQGQLSLVEFVGVLPGGTALHLGPGDSELPAARPVNFPPTQQSLRVYLAVPRERDGINNYAGKNGGRERFVLEHRPIGDAAGSGTSLEVALARRNVAFLVGDEPREDMESIPIAEIARREAAIEQKDSAGRRAQRFACQDPTFGLLQQLLQQVAANPKAPDNRPTSRQVHIKMSAL